MKTTTLLLALGTILLAGNAVAEETTAGKAADQAVTDAKAASSNTRGYGMAGCGLGSLIFGNKTGIVQIFAATTNGTFASQTFGITSGTSNCGSDTASTASTKAFIEANREALAKEIARGKGESIQSLSALAGCSDAKAVGTQLRKNFKKIFPNQAVTTERVSDGILTTLQDQQLSCKLSG